jgi:hypothetical protein
MASPRQKGCRLIFLKQSDGFFSFAFELTLSKDNLLDVRHKIQGSRFCEEEDY